MNQNTQYPPPQPKLNPTLVGAVGLMIDLNDKTINPRCNQCGCDTQTRVNKKNGKLVWLACIVLFLVSICLFWIPFCIDDWKDKEYTCAKCGSLKSIKPGTIF